MPDTTVTIEGIDEINGAIAFFEITAAPKHIRKATRAAMNEIVLPDAKALVPVDTGALEASLKTRALKRSKGRIGHQVTTSEHHHMFKGDQFYGGFVELGTEKMEADPYLRPALYGNENAIKQTFAEALKEAVEETGRFAKGKRKATRSEVAGQDFSAIDDLGGGDE
jgi:HK97 gp10 family phage protein